MEIIHFESKILLPSFICSDVIYSLKRVGIKPIFYQLDKDLKINFEQLKDQIEKKNIEILYIYNSFNINPNFEDFLKKIKNKNLSLIFDNAHFISVGGLNQTKKLLDFKCKLLIETFSPRKYFRLSEGSSLRLNGNFCLTETKFNFINLLIDKIKRSILLRIFLSNGCFKLIIYFSKFKNLLFKNNRNKNILKANIVNGVSLASYFYFKRFEYIYHTKSEIFYAKYINLFQKDIFIKDFKNISKDVFWLIPLKRNTRIKKLYYFLNESMINPFMEWPDNHIYLSNYDKFIRESIIYFRIDCLSCNNFLFDYISKLYYD